MAVPSMFKASGVDAATFTSSVVMSDWLVLDIPIENIKLLYLFKYIY